jgi:hypothetical protein
VIKEKHEMIRSYTSLLVTDIRKEGIIEIPEEKSRPEKLG